MIEAFGVLLFGLLVVLPMALCGVWALGRFSHYWALKDLKDRQQIADMRERLAVQDKLLKSLEAMDE